MNRIPSVPAEALLRLTFDFFSRVPDAAPRSLALFTRTCILVDTEYEPLPRTVVESSLRSSPLLVPGDKPSELCDCDDFALQLKASVTALYRQLRAADALRRPPAIGIAVSQSHALTVFATASPGRAPSLCVVDPSREGQPLTASPAEAAGLLGVLPLRLVYF